ncbi:hypothetical protein DV738_g2615, partial [Chaetothyriales sp. CBS 135597]
MQALHREYGPIVVLAPGILAVSDAHEIHRILVTEDWPKSHAIYTNFRRDPERPTLLAFTDKKAYIQLKRLISSSFGIRYIRGMQPIMRECIAVAIDQVLAACNEAKDRTIVIDIYQLIRALAIDIIGATVFGQSFNVVQQGSHPLPLKIERSLLLSGIFQFVPWLKGLPWFTTRDPYIYCFTLDIKLVEAVDDQPGSPFRTLDLQDEAVVLLTAGSETTANAEIFLLMLLAKHPDKLEKLHAEIDRCYQDARRERTADSAPDMPYLQACVDEAMRLYAAMASGSPRETAEDTEMLGYAVPKGTTIFPTTITLHLDASIWTAVIGWTGFYHSNGERHGSTNVNQAYLLEEDIRAFDAAFFGINTREAEAIDPQHRMLIETVYEAMEDAGLTISSMKGSNTGVYVGLMTGDYHELQLRDPDNMPTYTTTGTARSILSNRVSYLFDWKGPSMTIDTACSSSLVALHLAVQALRSGECQIAVAAGANLILGPEMMIAEANLHMLSPTGRSRMWDAAADGYARGEGIAAVILKTLSQAVADGDIIDYIIRETGVNQDGRTRGITMPSSASQAELIRLTYRKAGLDCTRSEDRCQFFEAHGTGTPRGDPIEAQAIYGAFFQPDGSSEDCGRGELYVGSIKSVIGHLEGCAGICLPLPSTFSAASKTSLVQSIASLMARLQTDDTTTLRLNDIAAALATQRSQLPIRAAFAATSKKDLIDKMKHAVEVASPDDGKEHVAATSKAKILGVFTGQGAQWAGMARGLAQASPLAQRLLGEMQKALDAPPDGPSWSIWDEIMSTEDPARIQEAEISQTLCTVVQVMVVDLLRTAGISFDCVVGHSSGEMGAAYAAGLISADSAVTIAFYRGLYAKLAGSDTGTPCAMMAASLSQEEARSFISQHGLEGRVCIAAINAPQSVTLSGDKDSIAEAKAVLESRSTFGRILKVDTAYHSNHMRPCLDPFGSALRRCGIAPLPVDEGHHCAWISTVHGRLMTTAEEWPSLRETYWKDNMAQPVLFSQAIQTAQTLYGPFDIALEVGPHPALKNPVAQTIKASGTNNRNLAYSGTLSRFGHDVEEMAKALAFVWKESGGHNTNLVGYSQCAFGLSPSKLPRGLLPRYAWNHSQRFWRESIRSRNYRLRQRNRHDLLGARCPDDHSEDMRWRNQIRVAETPWLEGHKVQGQIVLPAAAYLVMPLEAAKECYSATDEQVSMIELRKVEISRAITLSKESGVEVMFQLSSTARDAASRHRVGEFSCYSATTDDENGITTWQLHVRGQLEIFRFDRLASDVLPPNRRQMPPSLVEVPTAQFYDALADIGLQYGGVFQGLNNIQRQLGYATGHANHIPSDAEMPVMIHPALLDRLPVVVDSSITESKALTVTADLNIFSPHYQSANVAYTGGGFDRPTSQSL